VSANTREVCRDSTKNESMKSKEFKVDISVSVNDSLYLAGSRRVVRFERWLIEDSKNGVGSRSVSRELTE
jgi:hypothetical protein